MSRSAATGVVADGTIKNAGDLKGKIFAVEPNVPARLLAQMELKKYGLTLKDLQVKDIASADRHRHLRRSRACRRSPPTSRRCRRR